MRLKLKVLELLLQRSVEQLHKDPFDTSRWPGYPVMRKPRRQLQNELAE
jgi:hypothetical protein